MSTRKMRLASVVSLVAGALAMPVSGNRNFAPDWAFQGSTLTAEWHTLGQADFKAENGEIVATPRSADGGWLIFNRSYQDVQLATTFRCSDGCKAGVLLRAQKIADGLKGVFVSLSDGQFAAYAVTLNNDGKELTRELLPRGGGMVRFLPNAPPARGPAAAPGGQAGPAAGAAAAAPVRGGPAAGGGGARGVTMPDAAPYVPPTYDYKPNDWNTLEVVLDANILRTWLNDGPEAGVAGGRADDEVGRYGPFALYAGGTGEVRYKGVELKDLGKHVLSTEKVGSRFRAQRISDFYYAWAATAADVNRDGILDVIAGPFYYLGPDYTVAREIYLSQTNNPSTQYAPAMINFAFDYTGDGYPDVLVTESRNFVMYVNPGAEVRRWDRYPVFPNSSEVAVFKDIDGDGIPEAIILADGRVSYAKPAPGKPTEPWIVTPISGPGFGTNAQHGLGVGDINGDGRLDIVHPYGWWEQPPKGSAQTPWTYHPMAFGRWPRAGASPGGGEMMVYDVNGDGLNDVVTSLEGHGLGLAWYEQKRSQAGEISFVEHMIMDGFESRNAGNVTFSELHGATAADIDGDGIPDFIVGKRAFAHLESYNDPDPYGDAVLYVYRTVRNPKAPGGAEFVPELVHNRSGVGSTVTAVDLNKDGAIDILTSGTRGTFIFWNTPRSGVRGR